MRYFCLTALPYMTGMNLAEASDGRPGEGRYNVVKCTNLVDRIRRLPSSKGNGIARAGQAHEHWQTASSGPRLNPHGAARYWLTNRPREASSR
jgi:hypothetical protein